MCSLICRPFKIYILCRLLRSAARGLRHVQMQQNRCCDFTNTLYIKKCIISYNCKCPASEPFGHHQYKEFFCPSNGCLLYRDYPRTTVCLIELFALDNIHPRLEGCRVCADLTSRPLPLERLAESKLGTLRERQCERNQPLERVIFKLQ